MMYCHVMSLVSEQSKGPSVISGRRAVIACLLLVVVCIGLLVAYIGIVHGSEGTDIQELTHDGFRYEIQSENELEVHVKGFHKVAGKLTEIVITDKVTHNDKTYIVTGIAEKAFNSKGCKDVVSIKFPETIETICDGAFKDLKNLKSVFLPKGLKSVGKSAFEGCKSLITVKMEEGLLTIGPYAFKNSGLSSIVIANTVKSIGKQAFAGCPLGIVYFGKGLEDLGDKFMGDFVFTDKFNNRLAPTPENLRGHVFTCSSSSKVMNIQV